MSFGRVRFGGAAFGAGPAPAAAGSITGDAAITLDAATLAASGSKGSTGDLAATLGAVTLSAAGSKGATADAAITLGAATLSAAGTKGSTGTLAVTLDAATLSADGTKGATGAAAITLDALTLSAAGGVGANAGSLAVTLDALTLDSVARRGSAGAAAITLGAVTLAAAGTSGVTTILGAAAVTLGGCVVHSYALVGAGAVMSMREAALSAIATKLAGEIGIPVERGRRSPINADEALPRVVLTMGGHEEEEGDSFGTVLLRCSAAVEGYATAATDAALEAALNDLHGRCQRALVGAEIPIADASTAVWVEGRGMTPDAALLDISADVLGGFTWQIAFDLRAADAVGPFIVAP